MIDAIDDAVAKYRIACWAERIARSAAGENLLAAVEGET